MKKVCYIFLILAAIFNAGCSASYKELSNNNHMPKNEFSKYLLEAYKAKADYEAKEMHDWNSAKLYSEKALKAVTGNKIKPEKIDYWKISQENIMELRKAYENLMQIYESAIISDPYNLAKAVSSLDCWAEQQEEDWQTWDIKKCKEDYLNSMHKIYNNMKTVETDSNKKSNSATIVTEDHKKEVLQIIYFDFDKSTVTNLNIEKIKKFLKDNKQNINKYLIIGHTDTKGSDEYNNQLSIERALAVKSILLKNDISEEKISIMGKGEKKLLVKTEDEVPHPVNRRAEIMPLN